MSIQEKQVIEKNRLAFIFAVIIHVFQMLSTVMYQANRVGFMNTAGMLVLQIICFVAAIAGWMRSRIFQRPRRKWQHPLSQA